MSPENFLFMSGPIKKDICKKGGRANANATLASQNKEHADSTDYDYTVKGVSIADGEYIDLH